MHAKHDQQLKTEAQNLSSNVLERIAEEKKEREDTESSILDHLKNMINSEDGIKKQLEHEKKERLSSEETMLQLLEQTCNQIAQYRQKSTNTMISQPNLFGSIRSRQENLGKKSPSSFTAHPLPKKDGEEEPRMPLPIQQHLAQINQQESQEQQPPESNHD